MSTIATMPKLTETLTVTMPMTPPSELFPNKARTLHYLRKADISRPLREQAYYYAAQVRLPYLGRAYTNIPVTQDEFMDILGRPIFTGPVTVRVFVAWEKGRRKPDNSGLGHACKPLEDGLTDAKIWNDDRQVVETCYRQGKDPDGNGYVRFEITPDGTDDLEDIARILMGEMA